MRKDSNIFIVSGYGETPAGSFIRIDFILKNLDVSLPNLNSVKIFGTKDTWSLVGQESRINATSGSNANLFFSSLTDQEIVYDYIYTS